MIYIAGHDEYIYQMFKHNNIQIPEAGMYVCLSVARLPTSRHRTPSKLTASLA